MKVLLNEKGEKEMRFNKVEKMDINSKEVKKVLENWRKGIINKSGCISELFYVCGLEDKEIKNIEELGIMDNSMSYNVIKKEGLLRGIDIRNSEFIDKSVRSGENGLSNEVMEFLNNWVDSKKSMKLNEVVIGLCIYMKKSEVYCRKVIKKYEELKNIKFVKSR